MSYFSCDEIINSLPANKKYAPHLKQFPAGYSSLFGKRTGSDWEHDLQGKVGSDLMYNDILEYCLRKEFDEKLKKQQEEIDALKKALADTLAALAVK